MTVIGMALSTPSAMSDPCQWHPFSASAIRYTDIGSAPIAQGGAGGVDQGPHSDCWLESAVAAAAMTRRGSRLLSDMIAQSSGGYQVTFEEQPTNHIRVTQADITNFALKDSAQWACVVEAAGILLYPELLDTNKTKEGRILNASKPMPEPNDVLGLTLLTGHQAADIDLKSTPTQAVAELLERNLRSEIPMTAASNAPTNAKAIANSIVVPNHCFTVVSYGRGTGVISLRNPWGHNSSAKFPNLVQPGQTKNGVSDIGGGVIRMSLSTFAQHYRTLAYARIFHL